MEPFELQCLLEDSELAAGGVRPPAPPGEPYVIDDSLLRKVVHGAARCKSSKVNSLCEPLRFEFRLRDTPPRPV
jgi:hypothetical protein